MEDFLEFLRRNRYKIIWTFFALVFSILVLTINFWRTLLIILFVGIGLLIGTALDNGENVLKRIIYFFERLFGTRKG